jgi:hypothetical protein
MNTEQIGTKPVMAAIGIRILMALGLYGNDEEGPTLRH